MNLNFRINSPKTQRPSRSSSPTRNTALPAKFNAVIEGLAGEDDSLLIGRNATLQQRIESYSDRIEFYNERLEKERERLLKYYYNLELAISKIQSSQSALASLAPITPMTNSTS